MSQDSLLASPATVPSPRVPKQENSHERIRVASGRVGMRYVATMTTAIGAAFLIIVAVPYWYDSANLEDFTRAENEKTLIVRDSKRPQETPKESGAPTSGSLEDARLISLDYVNQMRGAQRLDVPDFLWSCSMTLLCLLGFSCVALWTLRREVYRVPAILFLFVGALVALQAHGLPHTNTKFHMIVGLIYATLLALSDFLNTLDLRLDPSIPKDQDRNWSGYLSALQYKHRYWTVVFNIGAGTVLTLLATVSFKIWDVFVAVFGESYAQKPLVGMLISAGLGLVGAIVGVFVPIRRHLRDIENAMWRQANN